MSSSPKSQPLQRQPLDLDDLQQKQLDASAGAESDIETQAGNGDKTYKLPTHEAHLLHVKLTRRVNNALTKKYDDQSNIVQFSATEFERMEKNGTFDEYDETQLLHDPRPRARVEADKTGDVDKGSPAAAKKQIRSLQDAQRRYTELTGDLAPSDKTFTELKEAIAHLEKEKGAENSENAEGEDLDENK